MISAHAQLALSYAHTGEHVAALPHAQQWALLAPIDAQAHWLLAQLLRAHNRLPESIVQARKLLRLAPSWQGLDLFLAKLYLDTRQMSLATPHFETALDTSKDDATQHASVQWEYAMQLLTLSEYERGWRYYNSRFNVFGATELNCCPLPAAHARTPLARSLLALLPPPRSSPSAAAAGRAPHCTRGQTSTIGIREVRPSVGIPCSRVT